MICYKSPRGGRGDCSGHRQGDISGEEHPGIQRNRIKTTLIKRGEGDCPSTIKSRVENGIGRIEDHPDLGFRRSDFNPRGKRTPRLDDHEGTL